MKTINRTVVIISPRQPYIDWANSFHEHGPKIDPSEPYSIVLLIPGEFDKSSYEDYVADNYLKFFELELESWMATAAHWPSDRSYEVFKEWFDVRVADMVLDVGTEKIKTVKL